MTADGSIRISVIDGALALVRHRERYPELTVDDAVRQLKRGPSHLATLDYERACELATLVGWDAFCPCPERRAELRGTLMRVARRAMPLWARASSFGRDKVAAILTSDQMQCLQYAGLLGRPADESTVRWWDQLSCAFRAHGDAQSLNIGRAGERLTLDYERKRLARAGIAQEPKWMSIEDNTAGYDVLSYVRDDDSGTSELRIEVKASTATPVRFFVTRREWQTAEGHHPHYRFHIWNLTDRTLSDLGVPALQSHIPRDSGAGRWREVELQLPAVLDEH